MTESFTDGCKLALKLAEQEACRFNHEYVGTEHLLLGLLGVGDVRVERALKECSPGRKLILMLLVAGVENRLQRGPCYVRMGKLPHTTRAKKVFELTIEEAGYGVVTPSHLLLGLIKENESIAAQVLTALGFTFDGLSAALKSQATTTVAVEWAEIEVAGVATINFTGPVEVSGQSPKPSCETCRFWDKQQELDCGDGTKWKPGHCRRRAPVAEHFFPTTAAETWCGEYEGATA